MSDSPPASEHIVTAFGEDLARLSRQVADMAVLAGEQFAAAMTAVTRQTPGLPEKIIATDRDVDRMEVDIELHAVNLIALRQPMARDLREAIAALKLAAELERIGDLAKNVAKRMIAIADEPAEPDDLIAAIVRMGDLAKSQMAALLRAHDGFDAEQAARVRRDDQRLDDMFNDVFRRILAHMATAPDHVAAATHLLFVAKNIERIGDHVTNMAELIIYVAEGALPDDERPKRDTTSISPPA